MLAKHSEQLAQTVSPACSMNRRGCSWIFSAASPGYFTTTFVNGIKTETTSTRRAGLIRFSYPATANSTYVVVDLTHDLQRSFEGGTVSLNASTGRVTLTGTFLQVRCMLSIAVSLATEDHARAMALKIIPSTLVTTFSYRHRRTSKVW